MIRRSCKLLIPLLLLAASWAISADIPEGRLMRFPDIYKDKIVFSYGGDLWLVDSSGGTARRVTTDPGLETLSQVLARRQVDRLHGAV